MISFLPTKEDKEPKRKMAANSISNSFHTPVGRTGQAGLSFMIPPMTQMFSTPTPNYCMNAQTSPLLPIPPLIANIQSTLHNITHRLESMDSELGQLSSIQPCINKLTDSLQVMKAKICDTQKSQNFVCEQYDQVSANPEQNK